MVYKGTLPVVYPTKQTENIEQLQNLINATYIFCKDKSITIALDKYATVTIRKVKVLAEDTATNIAAFDEDETGNCTSSIKKPYYSQA